MSFRKLIGLFQLGFLDLTTGAFIVHILHIVWFGHHAPLATYGVGAALAVLPDLDILLALLKKGPLDLSHRHTLFHQPLFLLVIPTLLLAFLAPFWGWLWALPLFWHYLHDTIGTSGGIQWLYPVSRKKFALWDFDKTGRRELLVSHSEHYTGMTLDKSLKKVFYHPTPTSIIEAVFPIILLIILALSW